MKSFSTVLGILALTLLFGCGSNGTDKLASSGNQEKAEVNQLSCDTMANPFGGGSGTESDPYLLCSVGHLREMAKSGLNAHFALTSDIDLANEKKAPLGQAVNGVFDGRNHVIRNFTIDASLGQHEGFLFAYLYSAGSGVAEIKNLKLENVNISGRSLVEIGALVSKNEHGKITNVHVIGSVSGNRSVGGLVGSNDGNIENCSFSGKVQGESDIGGLVGISENYMIKDSFVNGKIEGLNSIGGLVGSARKGLQLTGNILNIDLKANTDYGNEVGKYWGE